MPGDGRGRLGWAVVVAVAAAGADAQSVHYFSDAFNGPAFDSRLQDVDGNYAFSGGAARTTGGRNYGRTVAADYNTVDFTADLVYTQSTRDGPAGMFFGLGAGTKNGNSFDEPAPAIFFLDYASDLPPFQGVQIRRWATLGSTLDPNDQFFADNTLVFNGLSTDAPVLNATNTRLLFGTGSRGGPCVTAFLDLNVSPVPEPFRAVACAAAGGALAGSGGPGGGPGPERWPPGARPDDGLSRSARGTDSPKEGGRSWTPTGWTTARGAGPPRPTSCGTSSWSPG